MRNTIFIILSLFFNSCIAQNNKSDINLKIKEIETNLIEINQEGIQIKKSLMDRMNFYNVPGLSIVVINDNKIEWSKSFGVINSETKTPTTNETLFEAASITKTLVSVTALHFVEKGIIDLDKDVNEYLKSWKIPENEFTVKNKVTLRLLLSHQSGLSQFNFPFEKDSIPTIVQVLNGEFPALNKPATVFFEPGKDWEYSNIGYVIIQLLLEDITGKSLGQIMKEIVFDPLSMSSTTLNYPENAIQNKIALPHDASGAKRHSIIHPTALGQGALITTSSDLAKYSIELMKSSQGKSNKVLSQKMIQTMLSSSLELDPAIFGGIKFNQGLGVLLRGKNDDLFFGKSGDNYPGATCLFGNIPAQGKGFVIMTNSANGLPLSLEILSKIENEFSWPKYEESYNEELEEKDASESEKIKFVLVKGGTFKMGNNFDPSEGDIDELPIHKITLNDFYMSETEITNAQYDKYCKLAGKEKPSRIPWIKGENLPVMKVNWFEAKEFCEFYGYRLPTEAEWEYAARERGKKIRFANGKDIAKDNEINFNAKNSEKTAYSEAGKFRRKPLPVKSFPPNSLGLYDMSGNLAEWCSDYYNGDFYKNTYNNPECKINSDDRVIIRGGHIFSTPKYIRCTHRDARLPDTKNYEFGFRVVKDIVK
ncbi:serine hydrolase [Lentimicrobium sp. S6]|uniref:serine hydrolase n=1 Tax=Lentimicrobium sp. S6 TaxID=2735872 RepID=UPI0015575C8B|nr:serine hydrolase [Lentimicrobium sp. S6]NPD48063.1 serine hydrolase [Lentimicrobium sp. S6]